MVSFYGGFALRKDLASSKHLFAFATMLLWGVFGLLTLAAMSLADVEASNVWIEQHWYKVQNIVIPFQTQLDVRLNLQESLHWLFWLGLATATLLCGDLIRVGQRPGGRQTLRFSRTLIPTSSVVLVFGTLTSLSGVDGVDLASYASTAAPGAMLTISVCCDLLTAAIIIGAIATCVWGHSPASAMVSGALPLLPALVCLTGSVTAMVAAQDIPAFVSANWDTIRLSVLNQYAALPPRVFTADAKYTMVSCGILGFATSLAVVVHCLVAFQAVTVLRTPPRRVRRQRHRRNAPSGYGSSAGRAPGSPDRAKPSAAADASPMVGESGVRLAVSHDDEEKPQGTERRSSAPLLDSEAGAAAGGAGTDGLLPAGAEPSTASTSQQETSPGERRDVLPVKQQLTAAVMAHKVCVIIVSLVAVLFCVATIFATTLLDHGAACHQSATNPSIVQSALNVSDNPFLLKVRVINEFPHGQTLIELGKLRNFKATQVFLEVASANSISEDAYGAKLLNQSVSYDTAANVITITLTPPDAAAAEVDCLAAALHVVIPFDGLEVDLAVTSPHAEVNVSSPGLNFPKWGALALNTTDAPVSVEGLIMFKDLDVHSETGDVFMDGVVSSGLNVETGGTIRALNATSLDFSTEQLYDMSLTCHGTGRIIVSDVFAAWNATWQTDQGDIIGVVAAGGFEQEVHVKSNSGTLYFNNFILAIGTATYFETGSGDVHIEAITSNSLYVTTDTGSISMLEIFIGLTPSSLDPLPYPNASMAVTTQSGSISILGVGGTPGSDFGSKLLADVSSETGDIKVEVNGGGFEGAYSASAGGELEVSVAGQAAPATGTVGYGRGMFDVRSGGNVELAMLPGPF